MFYSACSVSHTLLLHLCLIKWKPEVDTELCKLREALKEAETKAKTKEEERNQALQQLQTSNEVSLKI